MPTDWEKRLGIKGTPKKNDWEKRLEINKSSLKIPNNKDVYGSGSVTSMAELNELKAKQSFDTQPLAEDRFVDGGNRVDIGEYIKTVNVPKTEEKQSFGSQLKNFALNKPSDNKLFDALNNISRVGANTIMGTDFNEKIPVDNKALDIGTEIIGRVGGYVTPLGGGPSMLKATQPLSNAVQQNVSKRVGQGLGGKILQGAAREGVEGALLGAAQSQLRGESVGDTVKRAGTEGVIGALGGGAFEGIGVGLKNSLKLGKLNKIELPQQAMPEVAAAKQPSFSGKLTPKNTNLENAITKYNDAIETIQNKFGTNQLRAEEIPLIKSELGIDIEKLVDDVAMAEKKGIDIPKLGQNNVLSVKAGVKDRIELPRIAPKTVSNSLAPKQIKSALKEATDGLNEAAATKAVNVLDNAGTWKDKGRFSYKRDTMIRNFEDIMGADAPEMKKIYLEPIGKTEADRIRFLNKEREEIASLGIKARSPESALVQKYGEGLIDEATLRSQTKDADKIIKAADLIRNKYDVYLDKINESLVRNDYDPIPKRKDYMRHFQEVSSFLERYGIPTKENKLPTDLNGLTANLKPGKNFFASALQRKGNLTDFDAIQGIDRYIDGASKLMYHTDNIKRLRGLDKTIRNQFAGTDHLSNFAAELTEYTNNLAGKKTLMDRGVEDTFGRTAYGVLDKIKKQVGANMVGLNLGSAVTNFIPLTQSLATTDKDTFVKGMYDTIKNVWKNDDFINQSDFLTRRMGSDPLSMTKWDKVGDKLGWLFKTVDNFTSQTIVRGKYLEGLKKGLDESAAMQQADEYAAKVMADRSFGSQPTLFNSKVLGPLTQFQLEVNNQLSFLMKDIPRDKRTAAASAIGQLFVYSYLFNEVFEKATGRRPAMDPIDTAKQAYEDYTGGKLDTTEANKNLIGNIANQLPFSSVLYGGRIPLQSAVPNPIAIAQGESNPKKELQKLAYLLPPTGGGQIAKTVKGATALGINPLQKQDVPGVYATPTSGNTYLRYPVSKDPANIAKGLIMGPSGFRETEKFYRDGIKPLTADQSRVVENAARKGEDPQKVYNEYMQERQLRKDIEAVKNNAELSKKQKADEISRINRQIKKLNELQEKYAK